MQRLKAILRPLPIVSIPGMTREEIVRERDQVKCVALILALVTFSVGFTTWFAAKLL